MSGVWLILACLCVSACRDQPPDHPAAAPLRSDNAPRSSTELRTTDGTIALDNLQAQIESEQRLATYGPLTVKQRAGIAALISMRGQFLGSITDYEQAEALANDLVRDAPNDGRAVLARAQARSTFHRFAAALADLDAAERLGVHGPPVESLRAGIYQAMGRYDEALAIRQPAAAARPDIETLAAEATLRADRGEIDAAERLFTEAPRHYRDVSPFPLAWLYFQQGLMWMREGALNRAGALFEAAHTRLPAYAAAQGHLAEVEAALGRRERAVALLRPLAQRAEDPDYAAQLARILGDAGDAAEARRWRDVAAARYDDLIRRHPEAFADHAAEFWLAAGNDAQRALALAQRNLEVRPTPRAFELFLHAAVAAHDTARACATLAQLGPQPWPSFRAVVTRAAPGCEHSQG